MNRKNYLKIVITAIAIVYTIFYIMIMLFAVEIDNYIAILSIIVLIGADIKLIYDIWIE
jgi:hypothetical protein